MHGVFSVSYVPVPKRSYLFMYTRGATSLNVRHAASEWEEPCSTEEACAFVIGRYKYSILMLSGANNVLVAQAWPQNGRVACMSSKMCIATSWLRMRLWYY